MDAAGLYHLPLIVTHHLYMLIQLVYCLMLAWLVALENIVLLRRHLFETFTLFPLLLLLLVHLQRQVVLTVLLLSFVTILRSAVNILMHVCLRLAWLVARRILQVAIHVMADSAFIAVLFDNDRELRLRIIKSAHRSLCTSRCHV